MRTNIIYWDKNVDVPCIAIMNIMSVDEVNIEDALRTPSNIILLNETTIYVYQIKDFVYANLESYTGVSYLHEHFACVNNNVYAHFLYVIPWGVL